LTTAPASPALTLTANVPDTTVLPVLTSFVCSTTTYDAAAAPSYSGCVWAITYASNTNGTGFAGLVIGSGNNANGIAASVGTVTSSGTVTKTYTASGQKLKFLSAGSYGMVVTLSTSSGKTSTASFPSGATGTSLTVTNFYAPPTATWSFTTPFQSGCSDTACTNSPNFNATVTPHTNNFAVVAYFQATGATQGSVYSSTATCGTGALCVFGSLLTQSWGGYDNTGQYSYSFQQTGATLLPKTQSGALSAAIVDFATDFATVITQGSAATTVTFAQGSTDVTVPACASVTFNPTALTTDGTFATTTATITCTDNVALLYHGVFLTATATAPTGLGSATITVTAIGSSNTAITGFPPYISGSAVVSGVFAIDTSGNTVLYGNCGDAGLTTIGCSASNGSGSGSSASTVTLSVFALFCLVVMALFA